MITQAKAMQDVRDAAARFVKTCGTATDAQWTFRPAGHANAWSIGDIVEHVTIANRNMLRRLQGIGEHPLNGAPVSVEDFEMPYLFYRGDEPPNVATPTGLVHADRSASAAFETGVTGLNDWFATATLDLRKVGAPHPAFGVLDGVQWLLFCAHRTPPRADHRKPSQRAVAIGRRARARNAIPKRNQASQHQ